MPPERVPDPLRQRFLLQENGFQLDYSKYIHMRDDHDCNVKFFKDCSGEFVNLIALHCANSVTICRIQEDRLECRYVFPEELIVKDVEYIRVEDGGYGLVVALNSVKVSAHPHCVALLRWSAGQLQLVRKLKMEQEITCMKVVADAESMIQLQPFLHPKMALWPHIVVVGTLNAHCFLFHFDQLEQQHDVDVHVPLFGKLTDGLKPFHDDDMFVYTYVDDCTGNTQSKRIKRDLAYVTCVNFLERSRTVLLGFSFGGVISISLSSCPTIDPLMYPCNAPVQFITALEPDDDPRAHLWFFVAYATLNTKPLHLCLYQVVFPEEESLPINERTWDRPIFGIKLVIPFYNSSRWISLQTLVRERIEIRSSDDSTRDSSRLGSEKDKSLAFFTYVANDRNGCSIKGGLFDLNAYYYKRLVHSISHDGTAAQQCAFMSVIHPISTLLKDEDWSLVKDSVVDANFITRFISNVSDAEQMFYPSALEIFVMYVAGAEKCYQFTLPSLPNQLLSTICADLEMHIADATSASAWLNALGFHKKEARTSKDQYAHVHSVLSVLIGHQRAAAIVQFIRNCDSSESRHMIATWIWEEIDKASKKLHETIAPLFARFSAPLSPAGQKSLAHVHDVFVGGVQIIRELVKVGDREQDETKEYMTSLEAKRFAGENLLSYSTVIHQLIYSMILPVAEDREIRLALEESVKERRSKISGGQLNVDKLVNRMRKRSPSEPLWHAEGPQWYPPALLNLLGPILLLNIPTKWKGQLLAFYLLDYANCKGTCTSDSDLASNLIELVTKQMNGILSMNKEEIQNVYKMWCADCGNLVLEDSPKQATPCSEELSKSSELERLMNIPRALSVVEEKRLKSLLDSVPFGKFRWQCYLAKNGRYDEMSELPLPPNADNDESVMEYVQLLPAIKRLRSSGVYSSVKSLSQPSWPPNIREAIEKFERERSSHPSSHESELPVLSHGRTPVPLRINYKANTSNGWKGVAALATASHSSPCDTTPTSRKSTDLESSEDDQLFPRNLSLNTLNNITDILRTPTARACAAAQAESQRKWVDTTPEGELRTAVPRSILKSAKFDRGASPSRTRLQFDLPLSNSSQSISEISERINQPNFDESFEYDGTGERICLTTEEFVPLISPEHERQNQPQKTTDRELQTTYTISQDGNGPLQKSFEAQDENEHEDEGGDFGRNAVETEKIGVTTGDFKPLFSPVPGTRSQSQKARDRDLQATSSTSRDHNKVLENSFEVQDEDEQEGGNCSSITTEAEQQDENDFGNVVEKPSEVYFEEQEEEEIAQDRYKRITGKDVEREQDRELPAEKEKDLGTSVEIQEEICEVDVAEPSRCESVVSSKVGFDTTFNIKDLVERPVTSSLEKQMEFDDKNERHFQGNYEDKTVGSSAPSILVSGNRVSVMADSATTSINPNFSLEVTHVKLVDYSFNNSTLETTPAPRTPKKVSNTDVGNDSVRKFVLNTEPSSMELDAQHAAHLSGTESVKWTGTDDEASNRLCSVSTTLEIPSAMLNRMNLPIAISETGKSVVLCTSPQSYESQSTGAVTGSIHGSTEKDSHLMEVEGQHEADLSGIESVKWTHTADFTGDRLCTVSATLEIPSTILNRIDTPIAITETGKSVVLCKSPQSYESHSTGSLTVSKHGSAKKTVRTPGTPTRHSMRLREKAMELNVKEAEDDKVLNTNSGPSALSGKDNATDVKASKTPVRKRTRRDSSTSETDVGLPLSTRKLPSRKRRNADDAQSVAKEPPSANPTTETNDEESNADTLSTHRVLRKRTPTRALQEEVLHTPASKTPRRSRKVSGHDKETDSDNQSNTGSESSSRTTRSHKASASDEQKLASAAESSPSRRTSARSLAKSKSRSPSISERSSSTSKAAEAKQGKFPIPETLGGLDARSFFDTVTQQAMAEMQSSRRRTLSDSGVIDLKSKSRQVEVLDAIPEVEEESGSRRGRSRRKEKDDVEVSTDNKVKSPRPRRANSASIVEGTPSKVTRAQNGTK
ncbi:hypothetical protein KIN20_004222 [Parelaphostrongylus tenuis]|uniref:ELYS beta-propeller domain-containing protein n=1 Tax=Parelaphostrongylus tenuis TaxID=148309 RepID=A0AAD5LY33_PARTN|nr:hypothetical protein KIN20_004222 [Parelaphostrongylus tenuis]